MTNASGARATIRHARGVHQTLARRSTRGRRGDPGHDEVRELRTVVLWVGGGGEGHDFTGLDNDGAVIAVWAAVVLVVLACEEAELALGPVAPGRSRGS